MTRVSVTTFERVKNYTYAVETPFMYESTKAALSIFSSANNPSNWFQGLAIILSPVALVALPATLIADTVSLPYDYYLYKKTLPQFAFWRKASKYEFILNDFSEGERTEYEKHYGEHSAYFIHKKIRHSVGSQYIHPNKVLALFKLADAHPEFKYSSHILRDISSGAHDLDNETMDIFLNLTRSDIETYLALITGMIIGEVYRVDKSNFADNYYNIVFTDNSLSKGTKLSILYALERAYIRDNSSFESSVEYRDDLLKKIKNNKNIKNIESRKYAKKHNNDQLIYTNNRIKDNRPSFEKLSKRLLRIKNYILKLRDIEFIQYLEPIDFKNSVKPRGRFKIIGSCLKLQHFTGGKKTLSTLIFPKSASLTWEEQYIAIRNKNKTVEFRYTNGKWRGVFIKNIEPLSLTPFSKCKSDQYFFVTLQ